MMTEYESILSFWFGDLEPKDWWKKDEAFDRQIRERFGEIHRRAVHCELAAWRGQGRGRLAEIIVLDQFSRNIFRDMPRAFAYDPMALALSQEAIAAGSDRELEPIERSFLYMPFMHSESPVIHEAAVKLFERHAHPDNLKFELQHKAIIDRFGRYPHRNAILGRASTPAEIEFLKEPNSSF